MIIDKRGVFQSISIKGEFSQSISDVPQNASR